MKTNIFLIYRYWRANKIQFAKVIASIVILVVLMMVSVLVERTECRRAFENMLYGKGNTSYTFADLSEEIFNEMQSDELVEDIGRTAVCGKLGDEYQQYTYGAYMDSSAEELEYLKLAAGRFPTVSGEVALYDYILEDLFFTTDPTSFIGKEITMSQYNFGTGNSTGEYVGELTLKVTGVICTDELREQKEYLSGWIGHGNFSVKSMPVIYLYSGDCDITEQTSTYALVRLQNDDILTEEQNDISLKDFLLKYNQKYKIVPSSRAGIKSAAQYVANFSVGSEATQTQIYQSDTMTVIRYFSVIAVVVSAISLFGILFSVMPERMKSLYLVRKIGCSKRRVTAIILTEWLFLLLSGTAVGIAAGIALYELILLIQSSFLGLSPLHGYTAEWAVLQVTDNPFVSAVICSVFMFALGYAVYFAHFLFKKKDRRKSGKVRSLRKILRKLSGNVFARVMQVLSLSLVLFAAVMCYSYYTMDGKGSGYFTDSELNGDAYYNYANVNMRDSKTDVCIYTSGNGLFGLAVVEDYGLPADTADKISLIDGVGNMQCYSVNTAFNIFYPKKSTDVPVGISQFYAELLENADEMLRPNERDYYNIPAVFGNKAAMNSLSQFVTEGKIGSCENGLTMVFYERDGKAAYPYKIGDRVNSMAIDGSLAHQGHDMEFVIEAIAVIPETAKDTAPITYAEFDFANGLTFAAPQETAIQLNTYKEK